MLHGIQAVRGLFAVLVVCHHVGVHALRLWNHSWLGGIFNQSTFRVDFFFVLSGFVLWASHRGDAGDLSASRRFLGKRLWRLYPLLMSLTLAKLVLLWLVSGRGEETYRLLPSMLALPQNLFPVITAAWTLSFELYFMFALALCLALRRKVSLTVMLTWGCLMVLIGKALSVRPGLSGVGFLTHPFILEFVGGMLTAELVRRRANRPWGRFLCTASVSGLVLGVSYPGLGASPDSIWQKVFWTLVFAPGIAGLALWERSARAGAWWLSDRGGLGRAGYSIFLSHGFVLMPAFWSLGPNFPEVAGSLWVDVLLLVVAAMAVLFGLLVEKWCERPLTERARRVRAWFDTTLSTSKLYPHG